MTLRFLNRLLGGGEEVTGWIEDFEYHPRRDVYERCLKHPWDVPRNHSDHIEPTRKNLKWTLYGGPYWEGAAWTGAMGVWYCYVCKQYYRVWGPMNNGGKECREGDYV